MRVDVRLSVLVCLSSTVLFTGCASGGGGSPATVRQPEPAVQQRPALNPAASHDPFPSTYRPAPVEPFAITNATILTAAGPRVTAGVILVRDGRIAAVGADVTIPEGVRIIDAGGRFVTPGVIDPHNHAGRGVTPWVSPSGSGAGGAANPAATWAESSVWSQDPMFDRMLAAGVTTLEIFPDSASTINGRTVVLKNVPALDVQSMKFPGAPGSLKLACGENPAAFTSGRGGVIRDFRTAFMNGADYARRWEEWRKSGVGDPPRRDLALDNIAAALNGELKVQWHCYRVDDMRQMMALAREFGLRISAFHHANEAFKIAGELAEENIGVATWAGDWSGYKMEAYDSIMETPAFIEAAGGLVAMHSDNLMLAQHLNHEAARSMAAGREAGIPISEEQAIRWITLNPARIMGIDDQTGSLEVGKMADILVWNTNPFSVYALPDLVFIDGVLQHDRLAPDVGPRSDFELGNRRRKPLPFPVPSEETRR